MQKVIIDSSSWVSYFLGIGKNAPICQELSRIMAKADYILIPDIIYVEVLKRLNFMSVRLN